MHVFLQLLILLQLNSFTLTKCPIDSRRSLESNPGLKALFTEFPDRRGNKDTFPLGPGARYEKAHVQNIDNKRSPVKSQRQQTVGHLGVYHVS